MTHSEPKRRKVEDSSSSDELLQDTELAFDEIKEENISIKVGEEGHTIANHVLCDVCLLGDTFSHALYLCFTCSQYLCVNCFTEKHIATSHRYISIESDDSAIGNAVGELIDDMENESDIDESLKRGEVCVFDRVRVKHELDKDDCEINGLCGLDNTWWVVCDSANCCIKIFKLGSDVLVRYIRIGSKPCDVTEIKNFSDSASPDSFTQTGNDSSVSVTKPDKQCIVAVTLPGERKILFIDVGQNPAIKTKSISTEKDCNAISFYDDKIFTMCWEDHGRYGYLNSLYMLSRDGVQLNVIQTGIFGYLIPYLVVVSGRIYLTDYYNDKVTCMNFDGSVLSEITMEASDPRGICVDSDNNVYFSAWWPNGNLYKLDFDLEGPCRPLLDLSKVYMDRPLALCYYSDKMFVSHRWGSALENIVSVIRLV